MRQRALDEPLAHDARVVEEAVDPRLVAQHAVGQRLAGDVADTAGEERRVGVGARGLDEPRDAGRGRDVVGVHAHEQVAASASRESVQRVHDALLRLRREPHALVLARDPLRERA